MRIVLFRGEARTAVVYSLLATCRAHGINERDWLEDVLRRMPAYELGKKDCSELLPGNWAAANHTAGAK